MTILSRLLFSLLISLPTWGIFFGWIAVFALIEEYLAGFSFSLQYFLILTIGCYCVFLPLLVYRTLTKEGKQKAIQTHLWKPLRLYLPISVLIALVFWGWGSINQYGLAFAAGNSAFRGFAVLMILLLLMDEVNKMLRRSKQLTAYTTAEMQDGQSYASSVRLNPTQLKIANIAQSLLYLIVIWGLMTIGCWAFYQGLNGTVSADILGLVYFGVMLATYVGGKRLEKIGEAKIRETHFIPWNSYPTT